MDIGSKQDVYLIEPTCPNHIDFLLDAYKGIVTNSKTKNSKEQEIQKYIVKGTKSGVLGFRSILERCLARYLGLDLNEWSVLAVSSGTNALRLALKALLNTRKLTRNEVIIPAITVPATAEAILMEGLTPVLADVHPRTWNLDVISAEKAISEKTVAMISVDWLGNPVDIAALKSLCDKSNLIWISDSAQSFGAKYKGNFAVGYADATIFSTGYPKVFHTAGRGGFLIIRKDNVNNLINDPTGTLRHEPLPEINAFFGLLLLNQLEGNLQHRRELAEIYRSHLSSFPGFIFQEISEDSETNHYQMSLNIIKKKIKFSSKELALKLNSHNIRASDRYVYSLDEYKRIRKSLVTPVSINISHYLARNSLTLPISNHLSKETCRIICKLLESIVQRRHKDFQYQIMPKFEDPIRTAQILIERVSSFWDIAKKPIMYKTNQNTKICAHHILVPASKLAEEFVSVEELLISIEKSESLYVGKKLVPPFIIRTFLPEGDLLVDITENTGTSKDFFTMIELSESGSAAHVALSLTDKREVVITKQSDNDGIDGNGKPWLKRQIKYLHSIQSSDAKELFILPTEVLEDEKESKITLPYIHGYSLAENILRGISVDLTFSFLQDVWHHMTHQIWTKNIQKTVPDYLEKAHLDRMARRIHIAAAKHPQLKQLVQYKEVIVNEKTLLNFPGLYERLKNSKILSYLNPKTLSSIHGDLNLYNILCLINYKDHLSFKLIDPRGTPLFTLNPPMEHIEPGDFIYDLAKMKFSLSGFILVRSWLINFKIKGKNNFELVPKFSHLATQTLEECDNNFVHFFEDCQFFPFLQEHIMKTTNDLWKQRLLFAESANFISDSACALGRRSNHEILPLYLLGVQKLNEFYKQHCFKSPSILKEKAENIQKPIPKGSRELSVGIVNIRHKLWDMEQHSHFDIVEILVKQESVNLTYHLLESAIGKYLPSTTQVFVSDCPPCKLDVQYPCVIIHSFSGGYDQLNAISEGINRTQIFFMNLGFNTQRLEEFRILTIVSTGNSTRNQIFCRSNDKLLMPGPKGISPLLMLIEQSYQLNFPCPGRWICNNDGIFLLFEEICFSGEYLGIMGGERLPFYNNNYVIQWRGEISSLFVEERNTYIKEFDEIPKDMNNNHQKNFSAGIYFIPHNLSKELQLLSPLFIGRNLNIVFDIVLPYFLKYKQWLKVVHANGRGYRAHEVWEKTAKIKQLFPKIEFISAKNHFFFHTGSGDEYLHYAKEIELNPYLKTFIDLPNVISYERSYIKRHHLRKNGIF